MTGVGYSANGRTMVSIEYSLPLDVESFEQGVALVVYAISSSVEPTTPPAWFALGKEWKVKLPWYSDQTGKKSSAP